MDGSLLEVTVVIADDKTSVGSRSNRTLTILEDRRTGLRLGFLESTAIRERPKGLETSGRTVVEDIITNVTITETTSDLLQ